MTKFYMDQIAELAAESFQGGFFNSATSRRKRAFEPSRSSPWRECKAGERLAPHRPARRRHQQAIYVVEGKIPSARPRGVALSRIPAQLGRRPGCPVVGLRA
jgi:hypothetical protein